jgi:hypothetical protein
MALYCCYPANKLLNCEQRIQKGSEIGNIWGETESQGERIVLDVGMPHDMATPENAGASAPDAQVGFRVSAANEMQNERHRGQDKKNVNQPTGHVKNNPPANPGNHQNNERYHVATHKTSRTVPQRNGLHFALLHHHHGRSSALPELCGIAHIPQREIHRL